MHQQKDVQQNNQVVQPLVVFVILLLMTLMQMTTDQYVPSLPAITKIFHSNPASIQLTLSIFMLGLSISHVFYGPLSDKIGRKPPLMFGVGLSVFGTLCCFLAPSVSVLILGRFLQGFGIGCCNSVGRSLVRDLFTDRVLAKIGSYVGIISIFIMAASPTLGGYIQEQLGWRANFLFLLIFGIIVWLLAFAILPETNKNLNPDAIKMRVMGRNYLSLLRSKIFLGYTLCACFACAGLVSYLTIAPFLFQDILGLTPLEFGQLTFFIAGAICFSGALNSQLVMHKGVSYMVFIGVLFMIVGGFSMLIAALCGVKQILYIMIPMALFSVGAGFTFINAFAGAFHPFPQIAGTVGALYASMQDLSAAFASGIIALCKDHGQYSLAIILLILGLSSLAAWYYLVFREERGIDENNR
ncbi:multidrug effflux MFS transporter [Legionella maioricensis]|uniref:Bcr/CflA family efflux transporter n=1 Tax=Legionella maioricensis TaxID=2896528 RepID=A0A9X2D1N2_9GAMM|nr:multidrug effflux MFS transporter [Legionella maioricensis]MCL9684704.1 multidrug effflux MFS transporter [Legionella maioricensis]MCL9687732.1 multidrug effflux MFS transporter [Legionella maioricensis]